MAQFAAFSSQLTPDSGALASTALASTAASGRSKSSGAPSDWRASSPASCCCTSAPASVPGGALEAGSVLLEQAPLADRHNRTAATTIDLPMACSLTVVAVLVGNGKKLRVRMLGRWGSSEM